MAHPKHKISKARRDKRRTHWKLNPIAISKCSQCGEAKLPHQVCLHCGYYNGRQVVKIKVKE